MRESQKMSLDYKLHTKIIESIIMIQRWFKTQIQREKYAMCRSAAIRIQSYWRMHLAQMHTYRLRTQLHAAIVIQSTFRMFRQRKLYKKLLRGIIIVQAHVRGKCTRIRYKQKVQRDRVLKERYKLRPTQSLPIDDRFSGCDKPVASIDARSDPLIQARIGGMQSLLSRQRGSLSQSQHQPLIHRTENQLRNLMLSSSSTSAKEALMRSPESKLPTTEEMVDSRSPRAYNLDSATKQYFDDSFMTNR